MIISHTEQPQVGPTHFRNNVFEIIQREGTFNIIEQQIPEVRTVISQGFNSISISALHRLDQLIIISWDYKELLT